MWLIIAALIIVIMAAVIWRIGASSQQPRRLDNSAEPDVATKWRPLAFSSGGARLEGWLLQPAHSSVAVRSPLVIIAHGWGSNRSRVLRYAHPLYEAGYAVFMYDARSHGNSESITAPSALMFRDDVIAAVNTAVSLPDIDASRIAIIGHSLGGFGALLALASEVPVKAVVTDSTPVRFETMLRAELKRRHIPAFPLAYLIPPIWLLRAGITREQFRAANIPHILKKFAGVGLGSEKRVPVLMIHSEDDDFISPEDLRQLQTQLPEGIIETLFVTAPGHSASEQDPKFWERVLPFIADALEGEASSLAPSLEPEATT